MNLILFAGVRREPIKSLGLVVAHTPKSASQYQRGRGSIGGSHWQDLVKQIPLSLYIFLLAMIFHIVYCERKKPSFERRYESRVAGWQGYAIIAHILTIK